jgi:EAL domain-containing protein (putative c-di-GMP-specific phosphodiesterase class I)/CheY-like chemotaxis protein
LSDIHVPEGLKRLLILDDDEAVGRTLGFIAQESGFEVRAFTRPAEFFAALDAWPPTHIAIDLVMPEMDGIEAMRLLAERGCQASIIITSGVGNRVLESARRTASEQGLKEVNAISKPFSREVLRKLLSDAHGRGEVRAPSAEPQDADDVDITEAQLRHGLEQQQMQLAYQPKIACCSGALAGFEALVRWAPTPTRLILPDQFVPLAEASGLIKMLTEQVCDQALRWFSQNFDGSVAPTLAINFSAKNLADTHMAERITDLCRQHRVNPAQVIVELTESSAMDDPVKSLALLTRLRMQGFQLSIDDFGTGFSSLVQLVRLPFSELKVDKSFVMTALESHEARAVIKSIVDLGKSLGLRVTAEGVEDAATLDYITGVGCDFAQGYFISEPLSGPDALAWSRRRTA